MSPELVADVGNSRIKWGRCSQGTVIETVSLPPDDPLSWEQQFQIWHLVGRHNWAVAGVHPDRLGRLVSWLERRAKQVTTLTSWQQVPLRLSIDFPSQVGMDRLLNAVAAKHRVQREISIFSIDAGSAVTVDWIDESGVFRGGAIFPGFGLMAQALHAYTAQLPQIGVPPPPNPTLPGTNTRSAIEVGVFWAVAGGIRALIRQFVGHKLSGRRDYEVFLTGGDAALLATVLETSIYLWPEMTLEGIRLAAEALP
jgi:type III pantothenate kinase